VEIFINIAPMGFLQLPGLGKVHFHEYGTGAKPMLAFHGYGMTGRQFNVLEKSVLGKYHVYGFDHFFHGESTLNGWTEKEIVAGMPRAMVKLYLQEWFNTYGQQKVSLMAYSIGADIALILLEEFPEWIDELILMAPDGLAPYKGFEFIQHHPAGRQIFRRATKSKWLAPSALKSLKKLRVINQELYTIAYNEIDTPKKRQDVYYSLNLIKQLKPDTDKLVNVINDHGTKCIFIFGKDDLLFPKNAAMPFLSRLKKAEIHEVPMGHWLVTPQLDEYLLNCHII
jgi:pimeloyl-ACP methyl ester carboxylesterase